ncbi:MAG: NAD+ synthase [Candidatus Levyibacteriota bacterium]|jgi:NAD+ synthase
MQNSLAKINPEFENKKIVQFIKNTLVKQKIEKTVIGISGGIDSATSLYLLNNSVPLKNIIVVTLPYFDNQLEDIDELINSINLPKENLQIIQIKPIVDEIVKALDIRYSDIVRTGNVMARVRMIALYDLAKKNNALVCGTENRSEHLLGYFTRFGDEASDIEPIRHLYKTQVYELAKYLGVPQKIVDKKPSANLWGEQTDEGEFGFTYQEADAVLYLYFDKKFSVEEIEKQGFENSKRIIEFAKKNSYKHHVPYII